MTTDTLAPRQHALHITDATGDTKVMWDPGSPDEVAAAKAAFDAAKKKKMLAYAVDPDTGGKTGEVIRDFDPERGKIVMVRQTAGG
jgi:hypothetical protein